MIDESKMNQAESQEITDEKLEKMLWILTNSEQSFSPDQWKMRCNNNGVGLKAFCQGIPLLMGANLIRFTIISSYETGMDKYRYSINNQK